ncbi:hypothetical protein Tco_0722997 [Tanacetum coccineum]
MFHNFKSPDEQDIRSLEKEIEVDKAKVDVISKSTSPNTASKEFEGFSEHAGFYRRFIKDFRKILSTYDDPSLDRRTLPFHFFGRSAILAFSKHEKEVDRSSNSQATELGPNLLKSCAMQVDYANSADPMAEN